MRYLEFIKLVEYLQVKKGCYPTFEDLKKFAKL